MQGLGLFTMEQCVYLEGNKDTQRGQLLTTGPSTYKIPTCRDIPLDFRVALLGRAPNPKAIFSSKVEVYIYSWGFWTLMPCCSRIPQLTSCCKTCM